MKERPILMNGPMVRATLAGDKTHTRRIVKVQPSDGWSFESPPVLGRITSSHRHRKKFGVFVRRGVGTDFPQVDLIPCPYGMPGDRLWVKETFLAFGRWETRYSEKKRRDEWHFIDMAHECSKPYFYAADGDASAAIHRHSITPVYWQRPSIFMSRVAARIALEITGVRVERLNDISDADAIAEGTPGGHGAIPGYTYAATPIEHYRWLWEQINGAGSWNANPWVWVIEFKRVENNN